MCPGVEKGKVANQGLQDEQRSSLCVLNENLTWTSYRVSQSVSEALQEEGLVLGTLKLEYQISGSINGTVHIVYNELCELLVSQSNLLH